MHIAIVIGSMSSGGAERATSNLSERWIKCGWQVTIITLISEKQDFYEMHPATNRISLDLASDSTNFLSGLFNNLRRLIAIRSALREFSPNIVIGMMTSYAVLAILAGMRLGIPVIVCERVYPPKLPLGFLWEHLRQWSYPHASRVVMQTNKGLQWLNETIPKARGVVIPNPVLFPLPDSKPRIEHSALIPPDRKLLLAVGRLDVQKGFDSLINAFALLSSELENWDLIILGEGAMRQALEAQVKALCLESRVYLPGRVGNVGEWYKRAELYVMSSRFEGFPNTLMEAMTHGCAVVSYDCDTGPRDIIRHEVDGLLVSPVGDVPALAKCLGRLMGDDTDRQSMAQRAIEVRGRFSAERVLALWDRLFEEVVG